jgi:DNA-binding XRE family transcriptional regulator
MRRPRDRKPKGPKVKKSYYVHSPRPAGTQPKCDLAPLVGARLAKLRKAKGVTQPAVARALGTSDASICRYEKGVNMPSVDMLRAFTKYYGVTYDDLLKEE